MSQKVYFVGSQAEVAHHAAPMADEIDWEIASAEEVLQKANRGDLAIFYSEHFDRFRECVTQLKSRAVATLYMIDGILEWRNAWENRETEPACPWTMRPALSDKVACIGYSQLAILNSWGNTSKTELVGIPRLDRLRNSAPTAANKDAGVFRILLMSAKCPGFTEEQVANTLTGFSDLKSWFRQNPVINGRSVQLTWRLTGDLAKQLKVKNACDDLTGDELATVVSAVDAVITTPSTAMLEAMLLKRPVAILDYNNTPQLVPAAWTISSSTQIQKTVSELMDVPAAKETYQQTILDTSLLPTGTATARMVELIKKMLECAANQTADRLTFPSKILDNLPDEIQLGFDHANLYPTFDEFQNAEVLELQSQLAHSRREIAHVNREVDRLKSELGQAHEIFEQIHRHPVAGPIVRLRQKLLDWMNRNRKQNREHDSQGAELRPKSSKKHTVVS